MQVCRMTREAAAKGLVAFLLLAALVFLVNSELRAPSGSPPTVTGIQRELASVIRTKLVTEGVFDPVTVSCTPPPGSTLQPPLHLVCQVVAHDRAKPVASPMWVEDVTCGLTVPAGTPNCSSSGGDALQ